MRFLICLCILGGSLLSEIPTSHGAASVQTEIIGVQSELRKVKTGTDNIQVELKKLKDSGALLQNELKRVQAELKSIKTILTDSDNFNKNTLNANIESFKEYLSGSQSNLSPGKAISSPVISQDPRSVSARRN